jgi:hypothetical protein
MLASPVRWRHYPGPGRHPRGLKASGERHRENDRDFAIYYRDSHARDGILTSRSLDLVGDRRAAFALATLGGYLLSVWIGLFGFREIRTTAGIVAGVIEVAAFAALAALAAAPASPGLRAGLPGAGPRWPASPLPRWRCSASRWRTRAARDRQLPAAA